GGGERRGCCWERGPRRAPPPGLRRAASERRRRWPGDRRCGRPAGRRAAGSGRWWRSARASWVTGLLAVNVPPIIAFVEFTCRSAVCYDRSLPELLRWRAPWGRTITP